jgi:hypothetical protein
MQFSVWFCGADGVQVDVPAWRGKYRKFPTSSRLSFSREGEAGLPLRDNRDGESLFISESRVVRISLLRCEFFSSKFSTGGRRRELLNSSELYSRSGDSRRVSLILRMPWNDMLNLSICMRPSSIIITPNRPFITSLNRRA